MARCGEGSAAGVEPPWHAPHPVPLPQWERESSGLTCADEGSPEAAPTRGSARNNRSGNLAKSLSGCPTKIRLQLLSARPKEGRPGRQGGDK